MQLRPLMNQLWMESMNHRGIKEKNLEEIMGLLLVESSGRNPFHQVIPKLYVGRISRKPTGEFCVDSTAAIDEPIVDGKLDPQGHKREELGRDNETHSRGVIWEESTSPKKD